MPVKKAETVLHVFQRQAFTGRPFAVQHFDGQRAAHCILQQFAAVFVSCHPQFLSLCVQIFFRFLRHAVYDCRSRDVRIITPARFARFAADLYYLQHSKSHDYFYS